MSEAGIRARLAILLDHFHLSIDEIARLTDRQINQYFMHKRDRYGAIVMPLEVEDRPECKNLADEMMALEQVIAAFRVPVHEANKARMALTRKYQEEHDAE